jgi:predicted RNA binding protein YcfA (HicA-like mRNA interferase family)
MWGNDAADVPIEQVVKALAVLGFYVVREGNHTALARDNTDTIPNHRRSKGSTYVLF